MPVLFRCHVDHLPVGPHLDAFRFAAHLQTRHDVTIVDCHDARFADILISDEQACAVLADRRLLRIGSGLHDSQQPVIGNTDDADAVRALVGRRQFAFVNARSRNR